VTSETWITSAGTTIACATTIARFGTVRVVLGQHALINSLGAVSALVLRETVALAKDADTTKRELVGAVERLSASRAVYASVTRNTGAGAIQADTHTRAGIRALFALADETTHGVLVESARENLSTILHDHLGTLGLLKDHTTAILTLLATIARQAATLAVDAHTMIAAATGARGLPVAGIALIAGIAVALATEAQTLTVASAIPGARKQHRASGARATLITIALAIVAGAKATADLAIRVAGALNDL